MQDPSTSTPSPLRLPTTPPPSPTRSLAKPTPSLREGAFEGLVGHRVLSGTGEELGVVLGVETDAHGRPRKLCFTEPGGAAPRYVHLRFVRRIDEGVVRLAGPREGYHITRVWRDDALPAPRAASRVMADPVEADDGVEWWGAT